MKLSAVLVPRPIEDVVEVVPCGLVRSVSEPKVE